MGVPVSDAKKVKSRVEIFAFFWPRKPTFLPSGPPKRPPKRVFFTFFSSSTDPWTVRHIFKVFQNFTRFFTDPIPGYHIFDLFFENLTQNMIPRYRTAQKTLKILKNVKNMTPRSRICCRPEKSEKNRKKRVLGLFGPPNGLRTPKTAPEPLLSLKNLPEP